MDFSSRLKTNIIKITLTLRAMFTRIAQTVLFRKYNNPKTILVHRIGTFGDSIVALPAVASIKSAFPNAKIDFLTTYATPINLSTIIENGYFDNIYLIDKKNRQNELKKLKHHKYDLFIDIPQKYGLYKNLRNMLLARFFLGIPSAFGWDSGMTKLFAKTQMEFMPPKREIDRFLDMLAQNGITPKLEFPIKIESNDVLDEFVKTHSKDKMIAFCIGTNVSANEWVIENWINLAKPFIDAGYKIALIGGEQEKSKGEQISKNSENILDFCGKLSISQSAYLLKNCNLAICHDTGAMHLSYAVGTKTIAVMSSRQFYTKWAPPQNLGVVIQKTLECSGCFMSQCPINHECMTNIFTEEVFKTAISIISSSPNAL